MESGVKNLCAIAIIAGLPTCVLGQTVSEFAAWSAMITTPIGAFAPLVTIPSNETAQTEGAFALRVGRWKLDGAKKGNSSIGATFIAPIWTKSTLSTTVGYHAPGCQTACDGVLMLGADFEVHAWQSGTSAESPTILTIWVKGSGGLGRYTGAKGGSAQSLVGSIPFSVRFLMANKSTISALLSPGFGMGSVSGGGEPSESGTRRSLGGGFAWTNNEGLGVHVGAQKVFVLDAPTTYGIGVSFNR